jgi:hypothetical protein
LKATEGHDILNVVCKHAESFLTLIFSPLARNKDISAAREEGEAGKLDEREQAEMQRRRS